MATGFMSWLTGGGHPRRGKLYALEAAPGLTVHLLSIELGHRGPFREACVVYVFGPEKSAQELYMHAAIYDLCLPPQILPRALFSSGACKLAPSPLSLNRPLFTRHVFYDPGSKARYTIDGAKYEYLGEYCSLLQQTGLEQLCRKIVAAREAMLSNLAPGLAGLELSVDAVTELPPVTYLNEETMSLVATFPNSLAVMDDPDMDISTIEEALIAALETQRIGSVDGDGFGEGLIDLFFDANPGKYAQVLRTARGVLMALGVKEFTITAADFGED